ncbi:MAG TPA: choice-of-anchor Q domain-containing protein, partial [Rhodanobacteraceae bacterium]|nr:choice-of-anchor Q domain-containing protein [Rhodanobacteraceae bacterium]
AVSGDTVDMSTLACSTITLTTGIPIRVSQGDLHLKGPAAPLHLMINGNDHSIVLAHYGAGTLDISNLTIVEGNFSSDSLPTGGCIYSKGNVSLTNSVVNSCTVTSLSMVTPALGGGVYTEGDLTLSYSTITESLVWSANGAPARGGGAAVMGNFHAYHSTISNNSAFTPNYLGFDGGVYAMGNVVMDGSTISGNYAQKIGAIEIANNASTASIINSTISSNTVTLAFGGIVTQTPLTLTNSTVAFNRSSIHVFGTSDGLFTSAPVTLQSSIIADNAGPYGPSDLGGVGAIVISGANNLITSSSPPLSVPPGVIRVSACPQLEPLADNGGPTHTHALKHTSPAIDLGDAGILLLDQRGAPRTAGAEADIGSIEWQPGETDERIFVSGFDGLCDQ